MANELDGIDAFTEVLDRLESAHRKIFQLEERIARCDTDLLAAQAKRDGLEQEIAGLRHDISTKDALIVALRASQNNNHTPQPAPDPVEPPTPPTPSSSDDDVQF